MTPQEAQQISDLIAQAGTVGTVAFKSLVHKIVIEGIGDAFVAVALVAVLAGMVWLLVSASDDRGTPPELVMLVAMFGSLTIWGALYFGASALVEIGAPDGVAVERILKAVHQ